MNDIVSKLSANTVSLLADLVDYERNVRPTEENVAIYKVKPGMQAFNMRHLN